MDGCFGVDGRAPAKLELPDSRGLIPGIVASDDFNRKKGERTLPLVWQWNHNRTILFGRFLPAKGICG